jgi:hypothetical protein
MYDQVLYDLCYSPDVTRESNQVQHMTHMKA